MSTNPVEFQQNTSSLLINATVESANALTKARLLQIMRRVGHSVPSSLLKPQIVSKLLELRDNVMNGSANLNVMNVEDLNEEERAAAKRKAVAEGL